MINTTSTASTPICSPQLPPEIVMNAGALQPFSVRQVATPLPPLPPKMKPPLTMCGTTAMHFACSSTSSGIPLSGIAIISCNTLPAFSSRSVASSRADPAQHSVPRLNIASKNITFFMEQPHFCHDQRQAVWCGGQIFLLRRKQIRSLAPAILYKMDHFGGHQIQPLLKPRFPDLEPSIESSQVFTPFKEMSKMKSSLFGRRR